MRAADSWKDYELLDATGGNRLERWGTALLVRPDPQVVWKSAPRSPLWAKADAVYHRSSKGGGQWEYRRSLPERWQIHCGEGEDPADFDRQPHRFQAYRRLSRTGRSTWGLVWPQDPGCGPAHPGAEPVRLHRRGHPGLRGGRGPRCAMWTPPRGWCSGARRTPPPAAWPAGPSAGWWMTAPSSWPGKSAGAVPTTPSSWDPPSLWPGARGRGVEAGGLRLRPDLPVRRPGWAASRCSLPSTATPQG